MRVARFIKSATRKEEYPPMAIPVIAFAGRSNVGKSSLINRLVEKKGLARTSSTPGRTQLINFFAVDEKWLFVDLPGYGYAKVPQRIRSKWGAMIEEFLEHTSGLKLAVVIVDARHQPTILDQKMVEYLTGVNVPFVVAATKIDKVSRGRRDLAIRSVCSSLAVKSVVPFSSVSGDGKQDLWRIIEETESELKRTRED